MSSPFVHLHCHSHFSLLDGASPIKKLVARAKELEMNALALTAQTDDPLGVGGQQLAINSRLVIKTFEKRAARHLDQILKARFVLGQQCQVIARSAAGVGATLVEAAIGGDIGFVADDRIDTLGFTGFIKLQRAVHIAMIGQRQRIHL